jgi:potassium-dependent mechanosensitive channel
MRTLYFIKHLFIPPVSIKYKAHTTSIHNSCTRLLLILCLILTGVAASSQKNDSLQHRQQGIMGPQIDTVRKDFVNQLKQLGFDEVKKGMRKFEDDRIETKQNELIENIQKTMLAATNYVEIGVDTIGLNDEQADINNWYNIVVDGVLINRGTTQTKGNLDVSGKILKVLLTRMQDKQKALDKYYGQLLEFRNKIDSLYSDSSLYRLSSDSATAERYLKKQLTLATEIKPGDSILKQALANVAALETKINLTASKLSTGIKQVEKFQEDLFHQYFKREFPNLSQPVVPKKDRRSLSEIIRISAAKGKLSLDFYVLSNINSILIMLLLIAGCTYFLRSLKQRLREKGVLKKDFSRQLVLRYPVLSATLLVLSLFQFIFPQPVFIFSALIWISSSICLTIIFRGYITRYWMYSWLTIFALFLLSCADNFIQQSSRTERWFMFVLSVAGVISCIVILLKGRKEELKEKWILYFMMLMGIMEGASAILNFFGRYNISKTALTNGFLNVIIGLLFLWVARLINEGLALASGAYDSPDKKLFFINFKKLGKKVPTVFYVLLVIGWAILLGRNFYISSLISEPVNDFLYKERILGNYSFTMISLVIFCLILVLSTLISKTVSFFVSDRTDGYAAKKSGIGSWLLLVRIAIFSIGFFIAFAAAGISMDKITIIISALGIGIGFGLQTLVNNLVSGLIISFEKPVNVGDVVEIGTRSGVMKTIGFRSSVVYTWDGADVIIPNGDLLNQHLVNWTLGNTKRRIDILVGVAYGTDLEKTKQILEDLAKNDNRVLQVPTPNVLIKEFGNSSIDLRLLIWVPNVLEWTNVQSDILSAIDIAFKENNIEIPFPQQDVHIRSVITDATESKKENKTDE